jgi:hypothetical protein
VKTNSTARRRTFARAWRLSAAGIALLTSTASRPSAASFSAWSRIKAINGEITTVIPGNSIAGSW